MELPMGLMKNRQNSHRARHSFPSLLLFGYLGAVCVLAGFVGGIAAAKAQGIILDKIADYALPGNDRIARVLDELGYSPTMPEGTWRAFPAVRKLDAAYKAAEAASRGEGDRFLAETIRKLSSEFESIRNNTQMRNFADVHPAADGPLRFNPAQAQTMIAIDRAAYEVIINIANQAERGALGGAGTILTRDLGLSESVAYEILSSSSSNREALVKAYVKMDRIDRKAR